MEAGVVATTVMAYPFIVTGVNVRHFGMSLPVGGKVVLFGLMMGFGLRRWSSVLGGGARAARRNMSTANFGMAAAFLLALVAPLLCKDNQT